VEDEFCDLDEQNNFFNVVYAGNAYNKKIQRPFLSVIKQLGEEGRIDERDFKVTFVGYGNNVDKEYIFRNRIEPYFKFIDDVTHAESVNIQMTSNVLLLLSNFEPPVSEWCTPGKFFEYLGTAKPILLLAQKKSAMADYLEWTKSGILVDPADTKGLKAAIMGFYNDWKNGTAFSINGSPSLPRHNFQIENLTNKLENIFYDVIR
jgi:glycosyltransferase involved in cell wall biosynthesis